MIEPTKTETSCSGKYPYIGTCNINGAWAVFYGVDDGIILSSGSSWVVAGAKVKERGFDIVDLSDKKYQHRQHSMDRSQ